MAVRPPQCRLPYLNEPKPQLWLLFPQVFPFAAGKVQDRCHEEVRGEERTNCLKKLADLAEVALTEGIGEASIGQKWP